MTTDVYKVCYATWARDNQGEFQGQKSQKSVTQLPNYRSKSAFIESYTIYCENDHMAHEPCPSR